MNIRICFLACIIILLTACSNETAKESTDANKELLGTWKVSDATRKGKITHLLDDMYFAFGPNRLEFNLPDTNLISYTYQNDSILLDNNDIDLIEVLSIGDSHLNIGFLYKQLYFQLSLIKEYTKKE